MNRIIVDMFNGFSLKDFPLFFASIFLTLIMIFLIFYALKSYNNIALKISSIILTALISLFKYDLLMLIILGAFLISISIIFSKKETNLKDQVAVFSCFGVAVGIGSGYIIPVLTLYLSLIIPILIITFRRKNEE